MDFDRGFSSGSRQAPDPHDQYLERENFYRKHTPRDPSSLFRCISEQLFDTQHYYRRVREECCAHMRRNRDYFESHIDGDFEDYMRNMQHFRTRGTLLELRALAYRYRRNVLLFEPYTLGKSFIDQAQFGGAQFMVFVAPDYHFDTVYRKEQIEDAAFCQSLVYELLYKSVFQLPDVNYAVERMLHDQMGTKLTPIEAPVELSDDSYTDASSTSSFDASEEPTMVVIGALTPDGRTILFDRNRDTKCILEDYRMCHFHNDAFDEYLDVLNGDGDSLSAGFKKRRDDSTLKDGDVSCVRQLLNTGIVPFPYKVAKALDPNIYRNIEFDVWSEMRRNKFMNRGFFSVGDKCFIRLNERLEPLPVLGNRNWHPAGGDALKDLPDAPPGTKMYVAYVQHIEKYTNLHHVYVDGLNKRIVVHSSTLRAYVGCGGSYTQNWVAAGGRPFNKFHRDFNYKYGNQRIWPRPFARNLPTPDEGVKGSDSLHLKSTTGSFQYCYQNRSKRFNESNRSGLENDSDNHDDDLLLSKKKAALFALKDRDTDDLAYRQELELDEKKPTGVTIFEEANLKKLLCSSYYYAESAKYFQCNEIIAMPAFIHTQKPNSDSGSFDAEQRLNSENLKRNGEAQARDKSSGSNVDYDQLANNKMEGSEALLLAEGVVHEEGLVKEEEPPIMTQQASSIVYEQYPPVPVSETGLQVTTDPNALYMAASGNPQMYAGGSTATYYMPSTGTGLDSYYPVYLRGGGTATAAGNNGAPTVMGSQSISTPYYCNYVYSNATGTVQTVTPYLLTNGGVATNSNGVGVGNGFVTSAPSVAGQLESQLIPLQTAIRRRDLLLTETPVNVHASPSYSPRGADLPMNDMGSLRFYYNLGVQCFGYLASLHGAQNVLNSLQSGDNRPMTHVVEETGGGLSGVSTPPVVASMAQSPGVEDGSNCPVVEVGHEIKQLSIEHSVGSKGSESTSSEATFSVPITAPGAQPMRDLGSTTATSSSTAGTTSTTSTNSMPVRNYQGPGYRRPPFNNNNNNNNNNMNNRGSYGGRNSYNNNYRNGGMQQNNQQQNNGTAAGDKNKDSGVNGNNGNNRGYNNNYYNHHYGYAYNRRNGSAGRFNNNYNNSMNHRKPMSASGASTPPADRPGLNSNDEKKQSQSPFAVNAGNLNAAVNNQRHGHPSSPATSAKGHYETQSAVAGHVANQQQAPSHTSEDSLSNNGTPSNYGSQEAYHCQIQPMPQAMPTGANAVPVNYFGAPSAPPMSFTGPSPHLPPPFGGNATGNTNPQQMIINTAVQPQQPQQPHLQSQVFNAPFYTYATYFPLDANGNVGMSASGDGANMILQPMPYMTTAAATTAPVSPYPTAGVAHNQHLMGQTVNGQQIAAQANNPMYYAPMQSAEPGTPVMQTAQPGLSWAATASVQDSIPWSLTTGGTPGNINSGPSSGIGSTESSPPYSGSTASAGNAPGTGVAAGGQPAVIYANQTGYNYPYPPPPMLQQPQQHQQQQQFWYPGSQAGLQQGIVGPSTPVAVPNTGGAMMGTPISSKGDGKP